MQERFPDLVTVLANFGTHIPAIISMMQGVVLLIALYFIAHALFELWAVSYDNALKYVGGNERYSYGSAFIQFIIGSFMFALSDLELVGILSRTVTGDFVNSRIMSYQVTDSSFEAQVEAARIAVFGVMQVVGFIAMTRGFLILNRIYNSQSNASLGSGFGHLIGGILAWNFEWVGEVVNSSLGINVLFFLPST